MGYYAMLLLAMKDSHPFMARKIAIGLIAGWPAPYMAIKK